MSVAYGVVTIVGQSTVGQQRLHLLLFHLLILLFLVLLGQDGSCQGYSTSNSNGQSSAKCQEITLRGPKGIIQTPNFPNKFPTPICMKWIIDSTNVSLALAPNQRKAINVYFTQMNLKEGLSFIEYDTYGTSWSTDFVDNRPELLKTRLFRTLNRYLGIELNQSTPYQNHLRSKDYYQHDFGFNITYEITPEYVPQRNDTCSHSACSFAGTCYVSQDYSKFYCSCLPGHFGDKCKYGKTCDPDRNISMCVRGKCRNIGGWSGVCYCPTGFTGAKCETPIRPVIKECPGPDCDTICPSMNTVQKPCSCHTGRMIPKGWVRYEGKLKLANVSLTSWDSRIKSKPSDPRELNILSKIETVLTEQLQAANSNYNSSVGNVSIISVGPAGEFVFQFFGDPSTKNASFTALTNLKSTGQISEDIRLGGSFNFDIQPSLKHKGVTLNKKTTLRATADQDFSLTCEAEGSAAMKIRWYKDSIPINSSLSTRYMYEDVVPRNSQDRSVSVIILYQVSIYDKGVFTCQASDMGEEQCASLYVDVLAPPSIEVSPMALTLVRNSSSILSCFANNDSTNHSCTYSWYRDAERLELSKGTDEVVVEELDFPRGLLLRILRAKSSATYSCVVENAAGKSSRQVVVEVLDSKHSPSCRGEMDIRSNISWKWTAPKQTAMSKCPQPGYVGWAQRQCQMAGSKPRWGKSDFSHCISNRLITINNTLQKVKMGFAAMNSAEKVMDFLASHLESTNFLYPGEGENLIKVLADAAKYSKDIHRVKETFPSFFKAVSRLLTFQESCVHQKTVITLINHVQELATRFSETLSSPILSGFTSEVLVAEMIGIALQVDHYNFPRKNTIYPDWLQLRVRVPLDPSGIQQYHNNQFASLIFIVYRNVTDLLPPLSKLFTVKEQPAELVSPIVNIMFQNGYNFNSTSHLLLEFDISSETLLGDSALSSNSLYFLCATLVMTPDSIRWTADDCVLNGIQNSTAYCQCDRLGQFAILKVHIEKNKNEMLMKVVLFHWSVMIGSIVCIASCTCALFFMTLHLQFRCRANSIYLLKKLVCLSIIFSILLIMIIRNETSSIALSTTLCSLLLTSLCCQLTKSLHILMSTQHDLFPWLRSVSLVTLLCAVCFASILPMWTAAAILSHSQQAFKMMHADEQLPPVLSEGSPVFVTFVTTVTIIVFTFLVFYYKAVLKLRSLRSSKGGDSTKNYIIEYRLKTLNRAFVITLGILVTILATILYGNILHVPIIQYFFGFSTLVLGVIIFICYTVKSEYPIPYLMSKFLCPTRAMLPDPENLIVENDPKGIFSLHHSPEIKHLENGQLSTGLLLETQQSLANASILEESIHSDATLNTFMGSSLSTSLGMNTTLTSTKNEEDTSVVRAQSVSNMKRPSISSSTTSHKIQRSMTNPPHVSTGAAANIGLSRLNRSAFPMKISQQQQQQNNHNHHPCSACCKKNKSFRSQSRASANNSSIFKPERGRCLLSEVLQQSDYVMPSISSEVNNSTLTTATVVASATTTTLSGIPNTTVSTISGAGLTLTSSSGDSGGYVDHSPQPLQQQQQQQQQQHICLDRRLTQFYTFQQNGDGSNSCCSSSNNRPSAPDKIVRQNGKLAFSSSPHDDHNGEEFDGSHLCNNSNNGSSLFIKRTHSSSSNNNSCYSTVREDIDMLQVDNLAPPSSSCFVVGKTTEEEENDADVIHNNEIIIIQSSSDGNQTEVIHSSSSCVGAIPNNKISSDTSNSYCYNSNNSNNHYGTQKSTAASTTEKSCTDVDTSMHNLAAMSLNQNDLLLVKKISNDLDILLDRPKLNEEKDFSDVDL